MSLITSRKSAARRSLAWLVLGMIYSFDDGCGPAIRSAHCE
jgi:hypothetical protein